MAHLNSPDLVAALDSAFGDADAAIETLNAAMDRAHVTWQAIKVEPPPPPVPLSIDGTTSFVPTTSGFGLRWQVSGEIATTEWAAAYTTPSGNLWEQPLAVTVVGNDREAIVGTVLPKGATGTVFLHGQNLATDAWVISPSLAYTAGPAVTPVPVPAPSGAWSFGRNGAGHPTLVHNGKVVIPFGFNAPADHGYWGGGMVPTGRAIFMRDTWGANWLRLFQQFPGGGECSACPDANNGATIDKVVAEYTAAGMYTMIDLHQYDFGAECTRSRIDSAKAWWLPLARQYGNNPMVVFNLWNEPEASVHSWAKGAKTQDEADRMCADRWYTAHAELISAIRGTGAKNLIVVDESQAGQGMTDYWSSGASKGSAVITRGADLVKADPLGLVMWDLHAYDNLGWSGPQNAPGTYTMAQMRTRAEDYFRRVFAATNRPVLIGEFGWQHGEKLTTGSSGFHAPYQSSGGSRTRRGAEACFAYRDKDNDPWSCAQSVAAMMSIGGTAWIGFQLTTSGDAFTTSSSTEFGQMWMAYGNTLKTKPAMAVRDQAESFRTLAEIPGRRANP